MKKFFIIALASTMFVGCITDECDLPAAPDTAQKSDTSSKVMQDTQVVATNSYDLKALVTPMTFSCELRDVRLTRVISGMSTGSSFVNKEIKLSSDKRTDSSGTRLYTESETDESRLNHSEKGNRSETKFNSGGDVRVSGGAKWGVIPSASVGIEASAIVGGGYSKTSLDESRQAIDQKAAKKRSNSTTDSEATEKATSEEQGTISEHTDESRLGGYELVFSVILRNMNANDTLKVDGANMRVQLNSGELPGAIIAKYEEQRGELKIPPNDEKLCEFRYPVAHEDMLEHLLRLHRDGRLGQLKLSLSGADIVVTSEKTGQNVLFDLNKAKNRAHFSVEFGERMWLPDWKVSYRHSPKSGPQGQHVTIREALLAIQGMALKQSDELTTSVFGFADDGSLTNAVDRPLLDKDTKGNYRMFALRLTKDTGATELCLPNAEIMKTEIMSYDKVALFSFNLEEFVEVSFKNPEYFSKFKNDVEKYLKCCVDKKAYEVYRELVEKTIHEEDIRPLPEDMSTITVADVKRYKERAQAGIPEMQYKFALCLYTGNGVEENDAEAVKWFREAAEKGHKDAQYRLGCCYLRGEGGVKNSTLAEEWLCEAAKHGHVRAQYELGYCYEYGMGVTKNVEAAAKWYRKAAEQGHEGAKSKLRFSPVRFDIR